MRFFFDQWKFDDREDKVHDFMRQCGVPIGDLAVDSGVYRSSARQLLKSIDSVYDWFQIIDQVAIRRTDRRFCVTNGSASRKEAASDLQHRGRQEMKMSYEAVTQLGTMDDKGVMLHFPYIFYHISRAEATKTLSGLIVQGVLT